MKRSQKRSGEMGVRRVTPALRRSMKEKRLSVSGDSHFGYQVSTALVRSAGRVGPIAITTTLLSQWPPRQDGLTIDQRYGLDPDWTKRGVPWKMAAAFVMEITPEEVDEQRHSTERDAIVERVLERAGVIPKSKSHPNRARGRVSKPPERKRRHQGPGESAPSKRSQKRSNKCAQCGAQLPQSGRVALYCSAACRALAWRSRNRSPRRAGKCAGCGVVLSDHRADARYCGPACRARAWRRQEH